MEVRFLRRRLIADASAGVNPIIVAAAELDVRDARALAGAPTLLAREAIRNWLWEERGDSHPPDLSTVDRVLAVACCETRATEIGGSWRVERSAQRLRLIRSES